MTKQKLDDGYQAVAFEVGKSLENAEARIRELEAQLTEAHAKLNTEMVYMTQHEFDRLCIRGSTAERKVKTLEAQLANETKRWLAAVDEGIELKAQLAKESEQHRRWYDGAVELGNKVEVLQARLAVLEREKKDILREWKESDKYLRDTRAERLRQLEAVKAQLAEEQWGRESSLKRAEQAERETDAMLERFIAAEARAEAMRKALAQIIKRTESCASLVATDVRQMAQAALAPTPAESEVKE